MVYAPIVIPTLCRFEHFKRCVESLKRNSWAKFTDIYIAVDYPAKPEHIEGYNKICDYLKGDFTEFASFNVIKRKVNFGSSKNSKDIYDRVLQVYDRFIRSDDDAEFSPNFIEYMDKCLMYYEHDDNVVAINGYSYPINWVCDKGSTVIKSNYVCMMWGTGFWKKKYLEISERLINGCLVTSFIKYIKEKKYRNLIAARYINLISAGLDFNKGLVVESTDVAWSVYLGVEDKYIVMPVLSKVRNWGFDGTGEFCQSIETMKRKKITAHNYSYSLQPIDTEQTFKLDESKDDEIDINKKLLNRFDNRSAREIFKSKLKLIIYLIIGEKNYIKLRDKLRYGKKHTNK